MIISNTQEGITVTEKMIVKYLPSATFDEFYQNLQLRIYAKEHPNIDIIIKSALY